MQAKSMAGLDDSVEDLKAKPQETGGQEPGERGGHAMWERQKCREMV